MLATTITHISLRLSKFLDSIVQEKTIPGDNIPVLDYPNSWIVLFLNTALVMLRNSVS